MPTSDHRPTPNERAPTEAELEDEDRRRSEVTVQDLLEADLADPDTPSRRTRGQVEGFDTDQGKLAGFDLLLRDWHDPDDVRPRYARDIDDLPSL